MRTATRHALCLACVTAVAACASEETPSTTTTTTTTMTTTTTAPSGPVCGDGVREGDEVCDGADLGGATCATLHVGHLPDGLGAPTCGADCALDTGGCDPEERLVGVFQGTPPPAGGAVGFAPQLVWDPAAGLYHPGAAQVTLDVPAGTPATTDIALVLGQEGHDVVVRTYPSLQVFEPGAWNAFYSPCWDYDCGDSIPPHARRPERRQPFLAAHTGGADYLPGAGQPLVAARGAIRLVLAVAYAAGPMPEAAIDALLAPAGAADATSLAAVGPWFAARSQAAGVASPVDVSVVWSGQQIALPPERVPTDYGSCASADFSDLIAPSLALEKGDVLVEVHWTVDGTQCANHFNAGSRTIFLFATPSYSDGKTLTTSTAHELAHLMGASDKYTDSALPDENGQPQGCWYPEGEDFTPRDIMCHRVATTYPDGSFAGFEQPPLTDLVVSPLTAREIGWEDLDGDGALEIEDACPQDPWCK